MGLFGRNRQSVWQRPKKALELAWRIAGGRENHTMQ
jgi:hypothetical protein